MNEIVVIGAGPAGVVAALRAADLGAKTTAPKQLFGPSYGLSEGQHSAPWSSKTVSRTG